MKVKFFLLTCTLLVTLPLHRSHVCASEDNRNESIVCIEGCKLDEAFALPQLLVDLAEYLHKDLKKSPFFKVSNLLDPETLADYIADRFMVGGQDIAIKTSDKQEVDCTFIDNKGKCAVIMASGFGNEKERMAPFVHMLSDHDIYMFNFRGHGYKKPKLLDTSLWDKKKVTFIEEVIEALKPLINWDKTPSVDLRETTFGLREEKDILAVLKYAKKQKRYQKIFYVGHCFAGHVGSKVAKYFDKMVIDSVPYSIQAVLTQAITSPELILDPQRGRVQFDKNEQKSQNIRKQIIQFLKAITKRLKLPKRTTAQNLARAKRTPILIIQGRDDLLTPYSNFLKTLKEARHRQMFAVVFKNSKHLINHIKYKTVYALLCTMFLSNTYKEFKKHIDNPKRFIRKKSKEIKRDIVDILK